MRSRIEIAAQTFGQRKPLKGQPIFVRVTDDGAWRMELYCPEAHEPEDDALLWCAAPARTQDGVIGEGYDA